MPDGERVSSLARSIHPHSLLAGPRQEQEGAVVVHGQAVTGDERGTELTDEHRVSADQAAERVSRRKCLSLQLLCGQVLLLNCLTGQISVARHKETINDNSTSRVNHPDRHMAIRSRSFARGSP